MYVLASADQGKEEKKMMTFNKRMTVQVRKPILTAAVSLPLTAEASFLPPRTLHCCWSGLEQGPNALAP